MKRVAVMLMLLVATSAAAQEPVLVPDVSTEQVEIKYSFTGAELLLFGAILYPGGRAPDTRADIVVVLKGPSSPITVREKQRILGMWLNAGSIRFRSAPGYYAVASSRPVAEIVDSRTAAIYELGLRNLQLSPGNGTDNAQLQRFTRGFVDLNARHRLYEENGNAVAIRDDVLYRARIRLPARVPVGRYTADTFLIANGRVLAVASRDIDIRKSGFERFVAQAAEHHGFAYGLAAVICSLVLGYAASLLFRRRN